MAYDPTTWTTGDMITAEKMNHLEQGVANEQVGPQGPKGDTGPEGPQGPKGDTGETGSAGAAAGFGTPTATVDATTGTPAVTAQATYVPTDWEAGDVITATKLNNMETGIAGALQTSGGVMTGNITMSKDTLLNGMATIAQSIALTSTSEKDLDKITKTGIYHFNSSPDITNRPEDATNFLLICVSTSSTFFQIYITEIFAVRMYVRIGNASSFGNWLQVNTSNIAGDEQE